MRFVPSLALALLVSAAPVAYAQPSTGTVFISGGALAAIEWTPSMSGFGVPQRETGGTVAGGMLGVGIHLTEKISARVEWSLTDALRTRQDGFFSYLAPNVGLSGPSFGGFGEPSLSVIPVFPETKQTTTAAFTTLAYHVPAGRASIELIGGVGLLNRDVETSFDVRIAAGRISAPAASTTSTFHAVAVVGADIAVRLTDHVAVVPQVRAYALGGGLSVRPGLSLRWTF